MYIHAGATHSLHACTLSEFYQWYVSEILSQFVTLSGMET